MAISYRRWLTLSSTTGVSFELDPGVGAISSSSSVVASTSSQLASSASSSM